uniref:NADH-ubiquinone oxidoreductase chain 4 n=1 Tax=Scelio sp. ZJUH_2016028 TaxID=2496283 RepID=A0A3S8V168_9HYME|nr:NADH dehydrogenase subunit 4 [Scelio sp. ZJUH_2016028]
MMSIFMFILGSLISMNYISIYFMKLYLLNLILILYIYELILNLNINNWNYWTKVYQEFSMDKVSFILIMLTIWMLVLMILSFINDKVNNLYINLILMMFMLLSLFIFFSSIDLIKFYLFYEIGLIPIFILIIGWGKQPERLGAGIYMILYTVIISLPFFLILMFVYYNLNSLSIMIFILGDSMIVMGSYIMYIYMIFIFLVKLPIYFIHVWLPKAHVEAPIYGSMILAGVMLKLGGYGFMRIFFMFKKMIFSYNMFFMIFIFWGGVIISLMCLRQIDLKMLVAYSSVVHMSMVIVGMMTGFESGMVGGLIMMVAHGLCSSALFCLLNLNYKRNNSRLLFFNKGMYLVYSNLSLMWFIFCVINMAAPPSINLASEILMILSLYKFSMYFIFFILIFSFFSGVYSIYLYSFTQHGITFFSWGISNFMFISEYTLMFLHLYPLILFIVNLKFF